MDVKSLYTSLLSLLGEQNWWPVHRKDDPRVEIIVTAILVQNTKWEIVEKVLERNLERIRFTMDFFLNSDENFLIEIFRGIPFLKRKIETIKGLFSYIKENYGNLDEFFKKDPEVLRKELLSLKGIGKETTDVIILYASGKRTFPVDKYTIFLFNCLDITKERGYERIRKLVLKDIESVKDLQEFHALIDVFVKSYCKKKKCCPIKEYQNLLRN